VLAAALSLAVLYGGPAAAQELSGAERAALLARKDALFQQMLRNPGDLDATFAYADAAAKLGDNEAAVSALERMLLFNPNLSRVQLELGALYFRMGSYEISRTYFEKALAANPPAEVKDRITTYLGQIGRLSATQQLSGSFSFGVQYQSDANLGPGQSLILGVLLNDQFVKKRDVNVFASGSVTYLYDLGTQDRDAVEVTGTGFANHYGVVRRLDLGLAEVTAGPRFNFNEPAPSVSAVSLKPYAIVNDVDLGHNQYFHTFGVGGEATAAAWQDIRLRSVFEFRAKNFASAPDRPLSHDNFNGSDKLVSLFLSKPITAVPQSELALEFDFLRQDTRAAFFANNAYVVGAAYRIRYEDPTGTLRFPLESTLFLSRGWADYDAADPAFGTVRSDRRWRFGVTQSFQVDNNVAITVQAQRDIVSSNQGLYAYTSNSVLIGPQIRF
jgi:tetratricopeptide (TPR) repeat protein